jgi:purine-binding chemotaxis protein CheW
VRKETEMEAAPGRTASSQYLGFVVAGHECAVGILRVREILEYEAVTPVPGTPPWVRGVMNLRGSVVPVLDLAVKFGLPPGEVTRRTCIVVVETDLEGERVVMGVLADAVSQVLDVAAGDVETAPAFGTAVRVDYLLGLGRVGDRFVLLLDIDRVLSAAELLGVAAAEAPSAPPPAAPGTPNPHDGRETAKEV